MSPHLTFFCELESPALQSLFSDNSVIETLKSLRAGISLAIMDLSAERAEVVRRLNREGIPVVAWFLPPGQGWSGLSIHSAPFAKQHYQAFSQWSTAHSLIWESVGIDIQPDIADVQKFMGDRLQLLAHVFRRIFNRRRLVRAEGLYRSLVAQIRRDGYPVESYIFPFMADERSARSSLVRRTMGLVDVPVDREVMVVYSSFIRPYGVGVMWSYARDAQAFGLGSTEAGTSPMPPLDWDEFSRDLRHAWHFSDLLYIFSLEGCVDQGFLERLTAFEWDLPVIEPTAQVRAVERWRRSIQSALWITSHLVMILLAIAGVLLLFGLAWRRFKLARS
jgi:hypothetical protein